MAENALQAGSLADHYRRVRTRSEVLCQPLAIEDYGVQPIEDASPPKWHLAHTTWFFETFLLKPYLEGYRAFDTAYAYLFNSYYNGIGEQFPRPLRGTLSRPTVDEVLAYRRHVDDGIDQLLDREVAGRDDVVSRMVLGLHHEQQHQELLVTDLKVNLGKNPLRPTYRASTSRSEASAEVPLEMRAQVGGLVEIGCNDPGGRDFHAFVFDNEGPRHRVYLDDFELANRPVTNAEFLAFIDAGGYREPLLWLSEGWSWLQAFEVEAPMYWRADPSDGWREYRLSGEAELDPHSPVTHVSYFEADAFARWAGMRLPTEVEWETVAARRHTLDREGFVDAERFHPRPSSTCVPAGASTDAIHQLFGDCWEWTQSAYSPYPGYQTLDGALGEYNGKFMASQQVLRGGSCATPVDHIRATYRNFFYPKDRWQFTGIRLAKDAAARARA